MTASSSQGCAEGEKTDCDPLPKEQLLDDQQLPVFNVEVEREEDCRERETEEDLVEDM